MVQAPPTRSRLSSTRTRWPACARYEAQARPLCPAPTIIASQRRAASSLTGAGRPIFPRTAAVADIVAVSTSELRLGRENAWLGVAEERFEAVVHVLLDVAVKEGEARLVGGEVDGWRGRSRGRRQCP